MHFLLFFPGKSNNAPACLRGVGLADFVDGCAEQVVTFRNLGMGLLVGWGNGIELAEPLQRWVQADGYLVGFWKGKPASPADLARPGLFAGYDVELGDKNSWRIPTASQLPGNFRLIDGKWKTIRKPQFVDFWSQSEEWFRRFVELDLDVAAMAADAKITEDEFMHRWMEFAVYALRQNYRVNPLVVSELGLFDNWTLAKITMAVVDGMKIQAVGKEIEAETGRLEAGLSKKENPPEIRDS